MAGTVHFAGQQYVNEILKSSEDPVCRDDDAVPNQDIILLDH